MNFRTNGQAASSPLIWAFVPYAIRDGRLEGFDFDTLQTKRELARAFRALDLAWIWQPIVDSNVDSVIAQVRREESIVLNLCDGIGGTPGPCVVRALERGGVRFTGADSQFYEVSTSKLVMKEMMNAAGVQTPAFEALPASGSVAGICDRVGTPLLVKPDISAASGGVFLRSKLSRDDEVAALRDELSGAPLPPFCDSRAFFAERFIEGPEFTVFVMGNWRDAASVRCLPAVERVFNASIPDGEKFLSYERYWGIYREETPPSDGEAILWLPCGLRRAADGVPSKRFQRRRTLRFGAWATRAWICAGIARPARYSCSK